ncbi:MAG: hypothetical protein ABWX96_16000 [Propionibacteriaceae bacterium]
MDLSAALNAQIRHLYDSLGVDHEETVSWVAALGHDLRQAVGSYLGLQMVMVEHGHAVTLTEFDPTVRLQDVRTSVRVPLVPLGVEGADRASMITFYAGVAGAFVDLSADLAYALSLPVRGPGDSPTEPETERFAICIDDPVEPTTILSGLEGAAELSTVNRALGLLIGNGHPSSEEALAELGRLAAVAGISVLAFASQLVRPPKS